MKRKNKKAIEKLELKVQLRLKKANTFPNSTLVLSKQNKTPTAFYLDNFLGILKILTFQTPKSPTSHQLTSSILIKRHGC